MGANVLKALAKRLQHINIQRSKLTLLKSRLLATFNCKMVAIKTIQSPNTKKLYFAAVSLRIHVEFLNDEGEKEKDR